MICLKHQDNLNNIRRIWGYLRFVYLFDSFHLKILYNINIFQ